MSDKVSFYQIEERVKSSSVASISQSCKDLTKSRSFRLF
jgi:hypothetical protein